MFPLQIQIHMNTLTLWFVQLNNRKYTQESVLQFKIDLSIETQTRLVLIHPLQMSLSNTMEAFLSWCLFSKTYLPPKIKFAVAP